MEFRILGPLEVLDRGRRVEIGGQKQRALLAVLLVHAGEVVSTDRLIDELWGASPPPTAAKTLQAHVSRLRRALGESDSSAGGRIETRGRGYLLRLGPGELDADRFRTGLEEARRALAAGDPERASEVLRQALALWRGDPLADFAYESFAHTEIARLEELRLAALEERIEADLALGRHGELIAELEALVDRQPLRERLRGQLMLALYRSDRQAEALQVYERGRQSLAEELGLEPSESLKRLERRILERDPSLAAPARPARPRVVPGTVWRYPRLAAGVGVAVLAVAAAAAALQFVRDDDAGSFASGGLGVLDPETGDLLTTVALGRAPAAVAVSDESVWVIDADDRTVSQVDADDRTLVRTFATASTPTDIVAGAGAIWIGNAAHEARFGGFPESISRLDPDTGAVDATIELRGADAGYFQGGGFERQHLAVTDSAVWAINPDFTVARIDPRTNRVVANVAGVQAQALAAAGREVWIAGEGEVARIDPRTNTVSQRIDVAAESLTALAVGAGAVWAADPLGGSVWRIEPEPEVRLRTIPVEVGVGWVAFGQGAVWASNEITDEIYRIDPETNRARVAARLHAPRGVAVGNGLVWGTATDPPSARRGLPAAVCSEVFYDGPGNPRLLLVSDLPLQSDPRSYTQPMVDAIRFVFERRGFRSGPYTVGYQSCDDSTAQAGGTDVYRCISNAKAYARKVDVVGVIGAFHSFCSDFQIPIANRAPDGPLAMISPSNTNTCLTRPCRGMRPGELAERYPTGERNYVRIAAADHLQALAQVEFAKQLGARRLFVAWDADDPYGFAEGMRAAARRLGLDVVGTGTWSPRSRRFVGLARSVASTRPDAVLLAGAAPPFVGALIRDLRARLAPEVSLVGNDGFAGFAQLIPAAGRAAEGMYVGQYGVPNAELPPRGRRFLADFAAARGSPGPDFSATYGAQAAEIMLDAIARSDGTRASVNRELRRTRVENGILGDIRFDENGDLLEGPITYFRVVGDDVVVDRVVTARAALLGR